MLLEFWGAFKCLRDGDKGATPLPPLMANDRMRADGVERLDVHLVAPLRATPGMAAVEHAQTTLPEGAGARGSVSRDPAAGDAAQPPWPNDI